MEKKQQGINASIRTSFSLPVHLEALDVAHDPSGLLAWQTYEFHTHALSITVCTRRNRILPKKKGEYSPSRSSRELAVRRKHSV